MFLGFLLLLLLIWGFLQTEWGQNWLAQQVTKRLSKSLQSHITIKYVKIGLFTFDKMELKGVLVEDQKRDTLLSAGSIRVRITDWFFFRDKVVLKYVGLEDAVVKFNRRDSVWNYQYLADYFSSPGTTKKKESGIKIDLKKLVLRNVSFYKQDQWAGNDLTAKVGALDMDADSISISNKIVSISNLDLQNPYFSILDYQGRRPEKLIADPVIKDTIVNKEPDWLFKFANVHIQDGRFRVDKGSYTPEVSYFDGSHIDFSKINGTLKQIGWTNDTIRGSVSLSTRERSGLIVKALKAQTTIHPKAMIFDRLYLQTNRSTVNNYFAMHYHDIGSMDNFIHAVTMDANFDKTTIASDDIAFFAPELKNWKKIIRLQGNVKGTVDALTSKDLEVWAGNNTYVHGGVSLVGLPNIDETLINIDAKELRTTYADAANFIPSIRGINNPNLSKLTYINFKGTYTGFINDFVTYGTIRTNLGTLTTDLNMKFPKSGIPEYTGSISTPGFQLGQFLNSPDLGLVDFHGNVKGKGLKWNTVDMNLDGIIHHIQYGDYTYQNITAKGSFSKKMFNGDFIIKDPNADLHLSGLIDLRGDKPIFNAKADIAHANLKELQLTNQNIELSGAFDLNLQASSLADMIGYARINSATLFSNGKQLSFDSLVVSSYYVNGLKTFKATSNEFDATLTGEFNLKELPQAFTLFLSRYYPAYIKAPHNVKTQTFTFDITTGTVEDYIRMIDPRLSGFNNSHLSGSLNMASNSMTVDADIPQFSYKQYSFSDVQLKGSGDMQRLMITGQATNAQIGDSLVFPQTTFSIDAANDTSNVTINTTANQAINQANLSAQIRTFSDGLSLVFNPSSFVLNGKTWSIEQGGELNFRKNTVVQGQVLLRESNQEIRMWTELSPIGDWNDLHVSLSNINLGDVTPLFEKKNRIEGLLTGNVVIEDPQDKFNLTSRLHTEELRIDNDSIGAVDAMVNYNDKTGLLTGNGNNQDPEHHIDFDLALNLKDTTHSYQDRISLRPTNFQLKYLNRFLNGLFSEINGYVTGNLDILGSGDDQQFIGKAKLKDASLKVDFTQVTYKINDTEIELKKDTIDFRNKNIHLKDRFGNSAILDGYITHKAFSNMYFDLAVQTESRQMELLNTTYSNNQEFYGRAMGSGSFVLVGHENNLNMFIDAKASETDSSFITIPPSRSKETGQADFMVERKYGREMTATDLRGAGSNLKYDVHIDANPMVTVEVILDELTGDVIRGRGTGDLRINAGTSTPLTINGTYDIAEGNYLFTFESFLKKPFILRKGGNNFIQWTGDPYGAQVHLEAMYTAEKVSFAPLANSLITTFGSGSNSLIRVRDDVNVIATLTGNLFHPDFSFKLEFPSNNIIYNDPAIQFGLQQLEKNPNEMNKQVTYLIVFNSFAPFENATTTGFNPFEEFTYNTISGLFFGEINKRLNQLLSQILRNNNLTLNFTGSLYNRNLIDQNASGGFNINQSNLNISVGKSLFNDRANFTIGGTFDVPLQQTTLQQNIRLFPDVTLELLLNKTGSLKATFFYREDLDFLAALSSNSNLSTRRYGSSISYGREFNTLGEFFHRKKKKKPTPPPQQQKTDSVSTQ